LLLLLLFSSLDHHGPIQQSRPSTATGGSHGSTGPGRPEVGGGDGWGRGEGLLLLERLMKTRFLLMLGVQLAEGRMRLLGNAWALGAGRRRRRSRRTTGQQRWGGWARGGHLLVGNIVYYLKRPYFENTDTVHGYGNSYPCTPLLFSFIDCLMSCCVISTIHSQ
jgi:hypothetical protein